MYRKSTDGAEVDPPEEEALQLVQEAERLEVQFIFIMAHTHCTGPRPGPGPALGQGPDSGTMVFHILYYVLYTLHGDRDRDPLFSIVPIPVPVLVPVPVPCSMYEPLCLTCVVCGKVAGRNVFSRVCLMVYKGWPWPILLLLPHGDVPAPVPDSLPFPPQETSSRPAQTYSLRLTCWQAGIWPSTERPSC